MKHDDDEPRYSSPVSPFRFTYPIDLLLILLEMAGKYTTGRATGPSHPSIYSVHHHVAPLLLIRPGLPLTRSIRPDHVLRTLPNRLSQARGRHY